MIDATKFDKSCPETFSHCNQSRLEGPREFIIQNEIAEAFHLHSKVNKGK